MRAYDARGGGDGPFRRDCRRAGGHRRHGRDPRSDTLVMERWRRPMPGPIAADRGSVTAGPIAILATEDGAAGIGDAAAPTCNGDAASPAAIVACEIIAGPSHSPPPAQ
jgi:hypothetical protein